MKNNRLVWVVALLAVGGAVWQSFRAREWRRSMVAEAAELDQTRTETAGMRGEIEEMREKAQAADEDVARLLRAIETSQATGRRAEMPKLSGGRVSRAEVEERFRRARELAKSAQDDVAATEELLWCFDEGMGYGFSFMALRRELMEAMGELAKRHDPMRKAMAERQVRAERNLLADAQDMDAVTEFAALSHHLAQPGRIVEAMSKLPAGDNRRQTLMNLGGFDALLEGRRYGDILTEESFAEISQRFEFMKVAVPPNLSAEQQANFRRRLSETTAKNVEALAGAGYSKEARELAERLLAYHDTPETRRVLSERLERAGRADLLVR